MTDKVEEYAEEMLRSIGTSLRHYMPQSKENAIKTMRSIIHRVVKECMEKDDSLTIAYMCGVEDGKVKK